jgi:hypothetical protein
MASSSCYVIECSSHMQFTDNVDSLLLSDVRNSKNASIKSNLNIVRLNVQMFSKYLIQPGILSFCSGVDTLHRDDCDIYFP